MYPLLTCGPSYWKLNYIAPVDVVVGSEIEVPEIPERLVQKSLSNITRTATGPDGIPFWVWKERAEILTPILSDTPGLCHGKDRISIRYPRLTYPKKSLTTVV